MIQQVFFSALIVELINEQCKSLTKLFNLSSNQIEYQYELAKSLRCDIPPLLRRKILIDAIEILHLIKDELNQEEEIHREKLQRLTKHIENLQISKAVFDQYC